MKNNNQSVSQQTPTELIAHCVRYCLHNLGNPISKNKILQFVLRDSRKSFDLVLNETKKELKKYYGIELRQMNIQSGDKKFICVSTLEHQQFIIDDEDKQTEYRTIFLVLSVIFLSKKSICSDEELWEFLNDMKINPEDKIGNINVRTFVNKKLVDEKYITIIENDQEQIFYKWGSFAEQTVSKQKILEFYKKVNPAVSTMNWEQNDIARKQFDRQVDRLSVAGPSRLA